MAHYFHSLLDEVRLFRMKFLVVLSVDYAECGLC